MKGGVDLNGEALFGQSSGLWPGAHHERWQGPVRPTHGLRTLDDICSPCRTLSRRPSCMTLSCAERISCDGVCTVDLSRKPARYRGPVCRRKRPSYTAGIRQPVAHDATLTTCNESRDWRIHAEFAQRLIGRARKLYAGDSPAASSWNTAYTLDSTTIDLCLSLFPWALFCSTKSAVKMHTLPLDLRGSIPSSSYHRRQGQRCQRARRTIPGGRCDLRHGSRLRGFRATVRTASGASLLRHARHGQYPMAARLFGTGRSRHWRHLRSNHRLHRCHQSQGRSDMRAVSVSRIRDRRALVFLTNNFALPAASICALAWRVAVELFFKWIRQHLRIKKFYGTSENAVKSQIWIAVSVYGLVAVIEALNLDITLHIATDSVGHLVRENATATSAYRRRCKSPKTHHANN